MGVSFSMVSLKGAVLAGSEERAGESAAMTNGLKVRRVPVRRVAREKTMRPVRRAGRVADEDIFMGVVWEVTRGGGKGRLPAYGPFTEAALFSQMLTS